MRASSLTILVLAVITVVFAGCQGPASGNRKGLKAVPLLDATRAAAAGLSSEEVQTAAKLCGAKCARCHKFYDPAGYDDTEWRTWMNKMSRKARLNPDQRALLERYLGALRAAP